MTFSQKLWKQVLSAGVDEAIYRQNISAINERNRRYLQIFSQIAATFMLVMAVCSFFLDSLSSNQVFYVLSTVLLAGICFASFSSITRNAAVTLSLIYLFMSILLGFGIAVSTYGNPDEVAASFLALMFAVPMLFTDRPIRLYLPIFCSTVVFLILARFTKAPHTWETDSINGIVFSLVSAVTTTFMTKIKVQSYIMEDTIRRMAITDQLTGLQNRHSYEERLRSIPAQSIRSVFCLYVDVNGLHDLNNAHGHAAGDRMLQYVASAMQNIFGRENSYRIGGDEYIALGSDCSMADVQEMVKKLRQAVESAGYHIAAGMEFQLKEEIDMKVLVQSAEQKMYQDKEAFYREPGRERRKNSWIQSPAKSSV